MEVIIDDAATLVDNNVVITIDNTATEVSIADSINVIIEPDSYVLSSGNIYGNGALIGSVPQWLLDTIGTEITASSVSTTVQELLDKVALLKIGVNQNIISIQTNDSSIHTLETSVVSRLDVNEAAVVDIYATKVTAAQASALAATVVSSTFGDNVDGYIASIASTYVDATSAIALKIDTVNATLGKGIADATTIINTKATLTDVVAEVTTQLTSKFGSDSDAYIRNIAKTYTDVGSATALSINQLYASYNDTAVSIAALDEVVVKQAAVYSRPDDPSLDVLITLGIGDYWIDTDHPTRQGYQWNGVSWDLASTDAVSRAVVWSANSSKLITDPNGNITGWAMSDSSTADSAFTIYAETFKITDGTTGYSPFSIVDGVVYVGGDASTPMRNIGAFAIAPDVLLYPINSVYLNTANGNSYIKTQVGVWEILTYGAATVSSVSLSSTGTVFNQTTSGTITPTSRVLTATVRGMYGTLSWIWYKNDVAVSSGSGTSIANLTVVNSDFTSVLSNIYKVEVSGKNSKDETITEVSEITIAKVIDGTSSMSVQTSRDSVYFNGVYNTSTFPSSADMSTGTITVSAYLGSASLPYHATNNNSFYITAFTLSGVTIVTPTSGSIAAPTAISADKATATFTVNVRNGVGVVTSVSRTVSYNVIRAGAVGDSFYTDFIYSNTNITAVNVSVSGTGTVPTVTYTAAWKDNITDFGAIDLGVVQMYTAQMVYQKVNGTWTIATTGSIVTYNALDGIDASGNYIDAVYSLGTITPVAGDFTVSGTGTTPTVGYVTGHAWKNNASDLGVNLNTTQVYTAKVIYTKANSAASWVFESAGTAEKFNGIDGLATTTYEIRSSNYLIARDTDTTYSPSSITLTSFSTVGTGNPAAFAGIYKIYINGALAVTTTVSTPWTSTYNYTIPANTTSIKIELWNQANTIKLDETGIAVAESIGGVAVGLSNSNVTFSGPAVGYAGIVYTSASCTVSAQIGTTTLSYAVSGANTFSVTQSTHANLTLGAGSGSGTTYTVPAPTAISADVAYIDLTITVRGPDAVSMTPIVKRINYSVTHTGATGTAGSNAKTVSLASNAQAFTFNGLGALDPATQSVVFACNRQNIVGATTWSALGDGVTSITLSTTSDTAATLTSALFASYGYVKVTATADGISDTITVIRLQDGVDAVTGYLTNESHVVASAVDGTGYSLTTAGGSFKVYYGSVDVTASSVLSIVGGTGTITLTKVQNGLTFSLVEATGVYSLSGASWTSDSETFTVNATYNGVTVEKVYTIAKSKTGASSDIVFARGVVAPSYATTTNPPTGWVTEFGNVKYLYGTVAADIINTVVTMTVSSLASATPTSGNMSLNIDTAASVTSIKTFPTTKTVLDSIGKNEYIVIYQSSTIYGLYKVTGIIYEITGIYTLAVTAIESSGKFTTISSSFGVYKSAPVWSSLGTLNPTTSAWTWGLPGKIMEANAAFDSGVAEITAYQRASATTTPTGGTFNFDTGVTVYPTGWYESAPVGTSPVFMSKGIASGRGMTSITWGASTQIVQDGAIGETGIRGTTNLNYDIAPPVTYVAFAYGTSAAYATDAFSTSTSTYIGIGDNRAVDTETNVTADYKWTSMNNAAAIVGFDGKYIWIKYSKYINGASMHDTYVSGDLYVGVATGRNSSNKSDNITEYVWQALSSTSSATEFKYPSDLVIEATTPMTKYRISGSSAWTTATATTMSAWVTEIYASLGLGSPIKNDKISVNLYRSNTTTAVTNKSFVYSGIEWLYNLISVVNGDSLVDGTLSATKLIANTITADKLHVDSLSTAKVNISDTNSPVSGGFVLARVDTASNEIALQVHNTKATGLAHAIYATIASNDNNVNTSAIYGTAVYHGTEGVRGFCTGGSGVYGSNNNATTGNAGVVGKSNHASGVGVYGEGGAIGVVGTGTTHGFWTGTNASIGGTVYPFTGAHRVLIESIPTIGDIVEVSSAIGLSINNTVPYTNLTTLPYSKLVFGVYNGNISDLMEEALLSIELGEDVLDIDGNLIGRKIQDAYVDTVNTLYLTHKYIGVNALGEGMMNVCGMNGTINAGDYICSSNIAGKGMKQDDDILHSYTVAKALETIVFDTPDQVKMIACTYHCG